MNLVSLYNRDFRHLNSSGPDDPTATVYKCEVEAYVGCFLRYNSSIRFMATESGEIIWAPDYVCKSISKDGRNIKPELLEHLLANCREATIEYLESNFKG